MKLANRELGTVEGIGQDGRKSLKMDGGRPEDRVVELYPATHPHLDHGYAVTSHSSQGQTAEAIPCISHKTGKFTDCSTQFLHRTKMAYYLLLKEFDA